jgi:hypothetical protein
MGSIQSDHNKPLITLTVITLGGLIICINFFSQFKKISFNLRLSGIKYFKIVFTNVTRTSILVGHK